jgi:thioredoxin reductase (NADPH)
MQSENTIHDLIIIGAGPSGLAAAIYAGREGLDVLIVEKDTVGGLAAITDKIDNYPGFPGGISGMDLADRLRGQAERFGAVIRSGAEVTGLRREADGAITVAAKPEDLRAKAVLIATGTAYRHLDVPGEAEQIGKAVHFCATCDGPLYRGKEIIVVGSGNSAAQESVFLAKFASKLTLLVRGPQLKCREILLDEIKALKNVDIVYNTSVTAISKPNGRARLELKNNATDAGGSAGSAAVNSMDTDGVFVFVGLIANTGAFADIADLDERGFIKADANFATKTPGVFVSGDVRSGSTWQIAVATGEGVGAALSIRGYLDALSKAAK